MKAFFCTIFAFFAAVSFAVFAADPKFDKDDPASVREYAEKGDPEAQYYLGLHYEKENNMAEAAQWYAKAAEQDDLDAQYKLGVCYENGTGVPQNAKTAVQWYRKAADRGIVEAQIALGACYENGKGIPQNCKEAVKWYRQAADRKNPEAQYRLGSCYENRKEVRSEDLAAIWYRRAAENGHPGAQYKLGSFYETGKGVEKSMNEAIPWYTKAAEQGNLDAQLRLGNYYSKADSKGTSLDMEAAIRWYTKAAELGSTEAKAKLEQCAEEQRQIEATPKAAAERIKKMTVTMSDGKTTVSFPNGSELELIKVEAGTFEMSKDGKIERGEVPHPVTLTQDFYLGRTEVTQALWKTVMGMKPSQFKGDDWPVDQVSWNDVMAFCENLNYSGKAPNGWKFTLPTETQWEYAARGGNKSKGYTYSGSNDVSEVAWFYGSETHPVGQKKANELGLYDMSGNVEEWCLDDWNHDSSKQKAEFTRGNDSDHSHYRVIRGGSYGDVRSALRESLNPTSRIQGLGFRVALVPESY